MGPKLFSRKSAKNGIVYSLRLLPIGGFVSMVGEDEDSDDERALCKKPVWQRIIITAAGSAMNVICGVILSFVMIITSPVIGGTTVASFSDNSISADSGLEIGDKIVSIDGASTHISTQVVYEISRCTSGAVDISVIRGGNKLTISDVKFGQETENGIVFGICDFKISAENKSPINVIKHTWHTSMLSVKMIWQSLGDLISGRYGMEAVSGPVGVTSTITTVAKESTVSLLYLCSVIAMNLGMFNLLPLPALDGGRIFFQLFELIFRRPISRKLEGTIHLIGIIVLFAFMFIITFKDIVTLF